jgi:hypothetical protein
VCRVHINELNLNIFCWCVSFKRPIVILMPKIDNVRCSMHVGSSVDLSTVSSRTIWPTKSHASAKVCIFIRLTCGTPVIYSSLKSQLRYFWEFCRPYVSYTSTDLALRDLQNEFNQRLNLLAAGLCNTAFDPTDGLDWNFWILLCLICVKGSKSFSSNQLSNIKLSFAASCLTVLMLAQKCGVRWQLITFDPTDGLEWNFRILFAWYEF